MTIAPIDWVIIVGYLVFALVVGLFFTRRAGKSTNEFFISGRDLPWWLAGTSMVATSFAADTPLFVTGLVRKGGISENWLWWCWAAGGMFSVFLLSRLWRRAEVVTDVELTELRYSGRSAAVLRGFRALYLAIPIHSITMAWVIVAIVKFMNVMFGTSGFEAVVICIAITTFYSVLSGLWGVVLTDFVQFIIAMGGSVVLCVLAVNRMGGLQAIVRQAQAASSLGERLVHFFPRPPEGLGFFSWEFWQTPFFAFLIYLSVQWWANKNADGGGVVVQRMASARDEKHALLGTLWFNIAHYALRPWPWVLVALASVVLFPNLTDAESAYPEMVKALAPAGFMGLMIASFLAAFMSTIDSLLNLSASYAVNDFYRRFVRRDASEKYYVTVSRIASVYFILLASCVAVVSDSISGLWKFLVAFSSGVGLVYILRWFWWRINAWSEISAMLASSAITSFIYLVRIESVVGFLTRVFGLSPDGCAQRFLAGCAVLEFGPTLLVTVAGSTLVWLLVTFLTPPVSSEQLVAFYRKVRPYGVWGRIADEAALPRPGGLWRLVLAWIAGTVMVLAATFSAGKFLLGRPREGLWYAAAALVGAVVVAFEVLRRERPAGSPQDVLPGVPK